MTDDSILVHERLAIVGVGQSTLLFTPHRRSATPEKCRAGRSKGENGKRRIRCTEAVDSAWLRPRQPRDAEDVFGSETGAGTEEMKQGPPFAGSQDLA